MVRVFVVIVIVIAVVVRPQNIEKQDIENVEDGIEGAIVVKICETTTHLLLLWILTTKLKTKKMKTSKRVCVWSTVDGFEQKGRKCVCVCVNWEEILIEHQN